MTRDHNSILWFTSMVLGVLMITGAILFVIKVR